MASKTQRENAAIATAQKGQAAAKRTKRINASTGEDAPEEAPTPITAAPSARKQTAKEKATSAPAKGKVAAPKATAPKAPKAKAGESQADKVRAYLVKNPDATPAEVGKATGVSPAYVWDIRAAVQRKAAKEAKAK